MKERESSQFSAIIEQKEQTIAELQAHGMLPNQVTHTANWGTPFDIGIYYHSFTILCVCVCVCVCA